MSAPDTPMKTFKTPVLLTGGGDIAWTLLKSLSDDRYPLVGVDSGALRLAENNLTPDLIIGDMDSMPELSKWSAQPEILKIPEQETTDFEKALYAIDAPLFLAFGFWGQRIDHSLATLHSLTKYRDSKRVLLIDQTDLMFAPQGSLALAVPRKTRVSLMPLKPVAFKSSTGLRYPLNGLRLESGSAIGVSNETTEDRFEVVPEPADENNYVAILESRLLPSVLSFLNPAC